MQETSSVTERHPAHAAPELDRFGQLLRRGWWALLAGVLIGVAAGLVARAAVTTHYTASASVDVTPTGVAQSPTLVGGRTNSDVINMDTEVQLATSDDVAARVHQIDRVTRRTSLSDLLSGVTATVAANTEVLTISYQGDTAKSAARLANDFAAAYLQQRGATAQAVLTAQINKITPQAALLNSRLKAASQQLDQLPSGSPQRSYLHAQVGSLHSQLNALNNRLSVLQTTVVTPGQVRSNATASGAQTSPSRLIFVAAGAAVGLLVGLLLAWLRVAVRRRLRTPDDVRAVLNLPVLATVAGGDNAHVPSDSSAFQDYRRIANILAATGGSDSKTILVTGQRPESTSAVASNLLRALSLASVHTALMRTSRESMATAGMDRMVREALVPMPNNGVVSAADLAEARGSGYLIAVASDPRGSADAQTTARFSDSVVIVVEKGARAKVAEAILTELDAVGAPILGVVLVRRGRLASTKTNGAGEDDTPPDRGSGVPATRTRERASRDDSVGAAPARSTRRTTPSAASRRKQ